MKSNLPRKVVILGNSAFAQECYMVLLEVIKNDENLTFGGFLSFEGYQADLGNLAEFFLGLDDDYEFGNGEYVVLGIGDCALRRKAFLKLEARGISFFSLIHPDVRIDPTVCLGRGNIVTSDCFISRNTTIGDGNVFNGAVRVGHDVCIGDCNFMGPGMQISGNVTIGSENSFGSLSVLLPGCLIGSNNTIAPLSAVYKGCGDNCYMLGNPALKVGMK